MNELCLSVENSSTRRWPERTAIKFAAGTFKRIVSVLADGEDRMSFMRGAVEREVKRREKAITSRQVAKRSPKKLRKKK